MSTDTKVALVTGGGTGIGRGISTWFARHGYRVVVGQSTQRRADVAAREIRADSEGDVVGIGSDLADAAGCEALLERALAVAGRIDVLVNNAAVTGPAAVGPFLDTDADALDRLVDVNVKAAFRCAQGAARDMIGRGEPGVIVNVASVASYAAQYHAAAYTMTKAALLGLTKALALELAEHHVRVVGVAPGDVPVRPDDTSSHDAQRSHPWARSTPWPRLGSPDDVAEAVGFLASPQAGFITGETLVVDGGWLAY